MYARVLFSASCVVCSQSLQVADGLSKLKHPHGGFLEGLTMYSPQFQSGGTRIIGQAFTVRFVPKADTTSPKLQGNYVSSEQSCHKTRGADACH